MSELELLENKDSREQMIDRIYILDRVGTLLLLPSTNMSTRQQVANYYGVTEGAIRNVETTNLDEIKSDGFRLYKRTEIENLLNEETVRLEKKQK